MTVKMRWHDSPHSLYHVMEHEMSTYIWAGKGERFFFFFFFFNFFIAIILLLWVAKKRLFEKLNLEPWLLLLEWHLTSVLDPFSTF